MRIWDAEEVQDTLDIAVLDPTTMQRVEQDIGLLRRDVPQQLGQVAADIDGRNLIAGLFQRRRVRDRSGVELIWEIKRIGLPAAMARPAAPTKNGEEKA
jgi:hypothetical protein